MGFFDDFGKKISSAGQEAIAKTKELADVAKSIPIFQMRKIR